MSTGKIGEIKINLVDIVDYIKANILIVIGYYSNFKYYHKVNVYKRSLCIISYNSI